MPKKKKPAWSKAIHGRFIKEYKKELAELGDKIVMLIKNGKSILDAGPDLLVFYKSITDGKGNLEEIFALQSILLAGTFIGKLRADAENADNEVEENLPIGKVGAGGMKN